VVDCLDVSDAAVLLVLKIHMCTSNATQISKHELLYAPARATLLVGPCQAAALRRECQQRAQFSYIRENLVEVAQAVATLTSSVSTGGAALSSAQQAAATRLRSFSLARSLTPPGSPLPGGLNQRASFISNASSQAISVSSASSVPTPVSGPPSLSQGAAAANGGTALSLGQLLAANTANNSQSVGFTNPASPTIADIVPMARSVSIALEGIIHHTEALLNHSLALSLEGGGVHSCAARGVLTTTLLEMNPPLYNALTSDAGNSKKTTLPDSSPIAKDRQAFVRTIARAKVYYAELRHVCGRLVTHGAYLDPNLLSLLPEFTADAIQRNVKLDCENVALFTPLRAGAKIETMISRFESFLEAALERVRDYVIFSGGNWSNSAVVYGGGSGRSRSPAPGGQGGGGSNLHSAALAALNSENDNPALNGRECLQILIEAYYRNILLYLRPFVGNKETFRKLGGQDTKNCVLRLIIENDQRFDLTTQLLLGSSLDLYAAPPMPMVDDINAVMDWYSECLLHDTRAWLVRTSQNATNEKTNKSDLPWDVELVGHTIVSFLPETLRFQLNVYTNICATNLTSGESDVTESNAAAALQSGHAIGIGMNMPSGMQVHAAMPVAPALNQAAITAKVNEMVLNAITAALVFLAEEFTRALQSRHWDRVDPVTGKFAVYVDFLCGVANDCHRVLTRHVPELQEMIKAPPDSRTAKRAVLIAAFGEPADIALRSIMKIIFTDVQATLIDFDTLWANPNNLIVRSFNSAVGSHLRTLRPVLEADLFFRLVGYCCQVIVMRFMVFLRTRCTGKTCMSADDVSRFLRDVALVKANFTAFLSETDVNDSEAPIDDATNPFSLEGAALLALEDITQGILVGKYLVRSSLQRLDSMCLLLTTDYDTSAFHHTATELVERYDQVPALHLADGSHKLHYPVNASFSGDLTTIPSVLLGCIAQLRTDAGPDLSSFLSAMLTSYAHHHAAVGARAASPLNTPAALAQDVIVRVFGAMHMVHSTSAASDLDNAGKSGQKGLFSPGLTMKHWREKAADVTSKKSKHNEEVAAELMRTLGLDGITVKAPAERESEKPAPPVRKNSGNNFASALSALTGTTPGSSYTEQTNGARSLHSDLGDEGTEHGTEKHRKKHASLFGQLKVSVVSIPYFAEIVITLCSQRSVAFTIHGLLIRCTYIRPNP
jgi:hypothetical protein